MVPLMVALALGAEPSVVVVLEGESAKSVAAAVQAALKAQHVAARVAHESSPAAACLGKPDREACLGDAAATALTDGLVLVSADDVKGKLALSLQLHAPKSGAVLAQEGVLTAPGDVAKSAASALKKLAAAVKSYAAKNKRPRGGDLARAEAVTAAAGESTPPVASAAPVPAEPAAPAPPPEPASPPPPQLGRGVKLASPGLNAVNIDPKLVEFYAEHMEQRLGLAGVSVLSPKEVAALIGLERQRQLLGCNEGTSCIAELAGALGVDGLLMGSLAKVGDTFQLNVKVVSANDATVLTTYAVRTDEEEVLLKQLSFAAKDMAHELYQRLNRGPAPEPVMAEVEASSGKVRKVSWAPAVFGVGFLAAATVTIVLANDKARVLHPPAGTTVDRATAERAAQDGSMLQTLSIAGFALGGACLATAAGMFLFGGPSGASVKTALVPSPGGGALVVGGDF